MVKIDMEGKPYLVR